MEKKIIRSFRIHPELLKLLETATRVIGAKKAGQYIERAIVLQAERDDVIRPKEIAEFFEKCNIRCEVKLF